MKPKKFEKKLALNKKTIANLKNDEMKKLQGGYWNSLRITACTCGVTVCGSAPCC